jgi:acetyl esterase/lipase
MGNGRKSGASHLQSVAYSVEFAFPQFTQGKSLCSWIVGHDAPFELEASSLNLTSKEFPPTFVVVAEEDELIPPKHSYDLYDALKAYGVDTEIGVGKGMKHGQLEGLGAWEKLEEEKGWWDEVILPSLTFAINRMV